MTQSHYSLRWNNHQSHILAAFDALLQSETLVDVTLVCAETSVRAHKVVLSACSPFFQRVFSENPCKHPVIVLKDFSGWEVQAIVDFMYKGEISVVQEQLQSLIKAAESLQVRGLANQDPFGVDKESTSIINQTPTPSNSPNDFERGYISNGKFPTPGVTIRTPGERISPFSPIQNNYEPPVKLPHMPRLTFQETLMPRQDCQSPMPRRKQARPRRRSGELCGAQDLTTNQTKQPLSPPGEETAENLCIKKKEEKVKEERKSCTPEPPEMDLSTHSSGKDFRGSPIAATQPGLSLKQEIDSQSLPFPPMPAVSALAMTPPHSKFFGLDSPLGLFPPGLDGCRNPLFDMTDPRAAVDTPMFIKKKMGRPKGQHSAPRGGPPRSWTNAELTEALQHVWNKKMTTSQASRIFGIPYNSLLMYVRGKYGKSLKLEQLRKDCIGGPNAPMDMLSMAGSNNNNNSMKPMEREPEPIQPNTRPSSTDQEPMPQPPVFNPFSHNFYPDFGTGFPIPVSMIHLLPQSEKNRVDHVPYGQTTLPDDLDCKERVKDGEEEGQQELFRPQAMAVDDRRELVQQNGQD
ncbi:protein jim lovell [Cylas formicarius]|uniref:protein jim lovell n=1 Tax=Cylas formicarius TaxID=197179 RepID=UPI002958D2F3|nr:protein jim lovell [Cylas formicarius]XP_060522759.1 protein jim lovell [Cylas formicarius]XP_060522760.1 protein jim lovell [Cylas formicarius]XP_060522761.1 protein jim lovell [Cylas formicarius]